jgi:hypothetical protein
METSSGSIRSDYYGGAKFWYKTDFLKPSDEIADVHSPIKGNPSLLFFSLHSERQNAQALRLMG